MSPTLHRIIEAKQPKSPPLLSIFLTVLSVLLIVFGAIGLVYLQTPLREESFDDRRDASVANGQVEVTTSYQAPTDTDPEGHVVLMANTNGKQLDKLELVFNVISSAFDTPTITLTSGTGLRATSQEIERTNDGYLVSMTVEPRNNATFSSNNPRSFAQLNFEPFESGELRISFDTESSKAFINNPNGDQLKHVPTQTYTITSQNTSRDDLYFDPAGTYLTFYTVTAPETVVPQSQLKSDQVYKIVWTYSIKSRIHDNQPDSRTILVVDSLNGSGHSDKRYSYSTLRSNPNGIQDTIQAGYIQHQDSLTYRLDVDYNNVINESSESNNSITTTVYFNTGTGGTTVKACNESCSSNGECPVNHRCFENKCRVVTNLSSASCSAPADKGLQRTCNQYCADSRECAAGFTCYFNRCRRPDNVQSTTCALPTAALQDAIRQSCNKTCSSNADCANNMRCFNNQCRLATNPSSTSCSAVTAPKVSGTYYSNPTKGQGGTADRVSPSPTARPTTRPATGSAQTATGSAQATTSGLISPRPTLSPSPSLRPSPAITPLPTPQPSNFLTRLTSGGLSLPLIALIAGVGLLLIVIVMALLNLLKRRSAPPSGSAATYQKQQAYEQELQTKINALRSEQGKVPAPLVPSAPSAPAQAASQPVSAAQPSAPAQSNQPSDQTLTPPPSTLRTQATAPAQPTPAAPSGPVTQSTPAQPTSQPSSMLERIRQKGLTPPKTDSNS